MNKLRVGIVGLGARGCVAIKQNYSKRDDMEIAWICDIDKERTETLANELKQDNILPKETTDYKEILNDENVDAVFVLSAWETHIPIAIDSLNAGKAVGLEVGGAYNVWDLYRLVETAERTGKFFMMLENCCYGRRELMALNMARKGVFGEIVHCDGGYRHDRREQIAKGVSIKHYRQRNYLNRNCDNYPTHDLLPIMKLLNINNGNRIVSLVSVASKASGLKAFSSETGIGQNEIADAYVAQGDIITTILKCAHGETITLTLDTTLPRYYSRNFQVHGTKGIYTEDNDALYLECEKDTLVDDENIKKLYGNAKNYEEKYDHPLWKEALKVGITGGHGGMDGLCTDAFVHSYFGGYDSPVDVYDAATCMSITPLSEQSIATGCSVAVPDFTSGKWLTRKFNRSKYSLL